MNPDLLTGFIVGLLVGFFICTYWCRCYVDKKVPLTGPGIYTPPKGVSHVSVTMEGAGAPGRIEIEEVYK